jgi:hypothetical protein
MAGSLLLLPASRSTSHAANSETVSTRATFGRPIVRVPVLSKMATPTRPSDDQHGKHAGGIAGEEIGSGAHDQGEGCEPDGVSVRQPLERRLALLSCADQLHNPGILTFACGSRRANGEWTFEVEATAQ